MSLELTNSVCYNIDQAAWACRQLALATALRTDVLEFLSVGFQDHDN